MNALKLTDTRLRVLFRLSALLVMVKVTVSVILNNRQYFPPDFESEFLQGREHYFYGIYQYAFYSHVLSGPLSLLLGVILISNRIRRRWPKAHRWVGRFQVAIVTLIVAPGGFLMALRADGGNVAVVGFSVLAILTAATALIGYRRAKQRRYSSHEQWMMRCFLLLTSAVVLRLIAGASIVTEFENKWVYPVSAWVSWLIPVSIYELYRIYTRRVVKQPLDVTTQP